MLNDAKLVENANRVLRILGTNNVTNRIDTNLFTYDAEKDLYTGIEKISFNGDYNEYLKALSGLNSAVTKFFEDVLVMDNDEKIKNNRLALLSELKNKYIILTDFSKISI